MDCICDLCKTEFTSILGLQYHIDNNVCEKHTCGKCRKVLANRNSYLYHVKHNVCDKKNKLILKTPQIQLPKINDSSHENFKNLTYDEYLKMSENNAKLKLQRTYSTVNIGQQQINIINITSPTQIPPAFLSNCNVTYVMQQYPTLIPTIVKTKPANYVEELFNELDGNPNRPEFNGAFISNRRDGTIKISDGTRFNIFQRKDALDETIINKFDIMRDYNALYPLDDKTYNKIENCNNLCEDDDEYRKDLENRMTNKLINLKQIINTPEWSNKLKQTLNITQNKQLNINDAD